MKKNILSALSILIFVAIIASAYKTEKHTSICDAPLIGSAHTGAPGEVHCATAGCHTGVVNSGPGTTNFDIDGGITTYNLGENYTATIKISQANIDKFGFQVISLKDIDNTFVGNYTLTDATNTRIINGSGEKKYVGSTPCGSDANPSDSLEWTFDWTAPSTNEGPITFYLATIATNHDHSTSGDQTYTKTLQIIPTTTTGIYTNMDLESNFSIYPNPVSDILQIHYILKQRSPIKISLFDIKGKEISVIVVENQKKR